LTGTCKRRGELMITQQDSLDRQAQWQMKAVAAPTWEKKEEIK
jgi:hypothetical protein